MLYPPCPLIAAGVFFAFGDIINLKLDDIVYCESYQHYIEINTKDSKVIVKKKISDLEKELDGNLFIRTHRSYIVNISYTKEIKKNSIILKNNIEIPISKMKKNKVIFLATEIILCVLALFFTFKISFS